MTAPLSKNLRERIVLAIEAGESCRSVAARFGIAVSSAVKWSQRYRMSGSVEPRKMGATASVFWNLTGISFRSELTRPRV